MEKTRVLFVLLRLDAGGSERVVFELARSLDPDKFDVFVAAFKGGILVEPLENICRKVFILDKNQGLDLFAMLRLAKIVKHYRIDIVNAHHYMPFFYSFLGTKVLNGKKLVYTEHSLPEVMNVINCVHGKIFNCMLYRINAVIGVSNVITRNFKIMYPRHAEKFHEILNGVDIERFGGKLARENVRAKWGFAAEHFVVGTVANFRKVKNHLCLVRAAGRLKNSHPKLRLLFVGTGFSGDVENSEEEVRALIRELDLQDRVVFTGYQENIPELLSAFDAFCLPSISEGMPVSLLEAMASGVIVIGSDVSGINEVVSNGQTGLLFPSDDDERLALLIEELMAGLENLKLIVKNAVEYINKEHSSTSWTQKHIALFMK